MVRTAIVLFFVFNQLYASEQINFLVLLPTEVQNKIALYVRYPVQETDADFIERTTTYRTLLPVDKTLVEKHNPNLNTPEPISSYSIDRTHIYTTKWKEITTKDEEFGLIMSHYEHSIIKIALATGQCIRSMQDPLICCITPNPKCIAVSRDESQVALLHEYYGDHKYHRSILKIVDPKTKIERVLMVTSGRISSIHFNKQSTQLIAYEATTPLKYHLIPLVPQEKHACSVDMSLLAYFSQQGICKELKSCIHN